MHINTAKQQPYCTISAEAKVGCLKCPFRNILIEMIQTITKEQKNIYTSDRRPATGVRQHFNLRRSSQILSVWSTVAASGVGPKATNSTMPAGSGLR